MDASEKIHRWIENGRGQIETTDDGRCSLFLGPQEIPDLLEKVRRVYEWIAHDALWSPIADLSFGARQRVGAKGPVVEVGQDASYSSFHLLPLLTLLTKRALLIVGSPGRGKTSLATLMAVISGIDSATVSRRVQRGHPQLSVADLLGGPLPSDLVATTGDSEVRVRWRKWLFERVRIIDEYNRIPTKTQSALLSLMAEGVAEMYENEIRLPAGAWYLTANDAHGGGTFVVVEALRDRIDAVVRSPSLHPAHVDRLTEHMRSTTAVVPDDLKFGDGELDTLGQLIRHIPISADAKRGVGFFISSLEFCRRASGDISRMNKDVVHLGGRRIADVCNEDCPLDKDVHLCSQTERGISVRALESLFNLSQALAFFRGRSQVEIEDVRAIIPFVLVERLVPNEASAFFSGEERQRTLTDREGWVRELFDRSLHQLSSYSALQEETRKLIQIADDVTTTAAARRAAAKIKRSMGELVDTRELCAPVHADLVLLQGAHARLLRRFPQRS